ncbi:hypothetical protein pb186bvf_020477 [Paramecium bursaria]
MDIQLKGYEQLLRILLILASSEIFSCINPQSFNNDSKNTEIRNQIQNYPSLNFQLQQLTLVLQYENLCIRYLIHVSSSDIVVIQFAS